jgi:FkbM family methyltransferase
MNHDIPPKLAMVTTRHGKMSIPTDDTIIGKSLQLYGEWAMLELEKIMAFIPQGSTVVDVGACFGTHALAFAQATGTTGRVIAIEASRQNASILQQNTKPQDGYAKIEIIKAAVADREGLFFDEHLAGDNSGGTYLSVQSEESTETGIGSVTLDSLELENVSLVKLDIEGMEAAALSGGADLLDRNRPVIFSEVNTLSDCSNVMRVLDAWDFRYFATVSNAFNPDNFNEYATDIFTGGSEVGLFSIPAERVSDYVEQIEQHNLVAIENIDDLLKVLMLSPQYALNLLMSDDLQPMLKTASAPVWKEDLAKQQTLLTQLQHRFAQLQHRFAQLQNRLAQSQDRFAQLEAQFREYCHWSEQTDKYGQQLERSTSKLPFSLYYKNKKKYLTAFRVLREARAQRHTILQSDHAEPAPPEEKHPAGYKANILTHLQPMPIEEVPPPSEQTALSANDLLDRMSSDRQLILSFSHDNYLESTGGTQLCIGLEQQAANEAGSDYLHLYPLTPLPGLAAQGDRSAAILGLSLNGTAIGVTSYQSLIDLASAKTGKTRVVLHQLLGHIAEDIAEVVKASGDEAPIFWLHDFFLLCQSMHLLRNQVTFCGAPKIGSMACGICSYGEVRPQHQKRMAQIFEAAPFQLVAPSEFVAEIVRTRFMLPYASLTVQPHMRLSSAPASEFQPSNPDRLRIAYVGAAVDHKGWPNFVEAASTFHRDGKYDFYYFGVHEAPPEITPVKVSTSRDDPQAMIRALRENQIDMVVHISPTPETFSLSAHEALVAGAFLVTNRSSGNTARLIAQSERGCVLEHESDLMTAFADGRIAHLAEAARQRRKTKQDVVMYSRLSMALIAPEELN